MIARQFLDGKTTDAKEREHLDSILRLARVCLDTEATLRRHQRRYGGFGPQARKFADLIAYCERRIRQEAAELSSLEVEGGAE